MVSRMIRQLRNLRDTPDHDTNLLHENRDSVETSCLKLWEFLERLEGQYAQTTMKALLDGQRPRTSEQNGESSPAPGSERPKTNIKGVRLAHRKRPPSPFSRTTQ